MISGIIYDKDEKECTFLSKLVKNNIAFRSNNDSSIALCYTKEKYLCALKETDLNDFCCLDFDSENGKNDASLLRKSFPNSALLLLVDMSVSPKEYVRPDILPSAIVLRPSDEDSIRETLSEFLDTVLKTPENSGNQCINVDTKEGVTKIPFDTILYIEASAKKVYIRTRKEEYGYYETLDNLETILPDRFARCHRGYIVNLDKVKQYVGSESTLYLTDGSMIPVSRSYKSIIREVLK